MHGGSLGEYVRVRGSFTRSVHLERDFGNPAEYFATESSRLALEAVREALASPADRAMILIGAYGSGKSAFCVYLARLLSKAAPDGLPEQSREDGDNVIGAGLLPVLKVGARQPLSSALVVALSEVLEGAGHEELLGRLTESIPGVLDDIPSPRAAADMFAAVARALPGGLLLVIDELGKFLEYAAAHPGDSDPIVLQELAEAAARSELGKPFLIVGVLHQNIEAYARTLSRREQAEWHKVAERFRQTTFYPSDRERIDLIGRALYQAKPVSDCSAVSDTVRRFCAEYVAAHPTLAGNEAMLRIWMEHAYPLHPLTLLALPVLFRRAGQSHRSLFTFLHAEEAYAFGDFLKETSFDAASPPFYPPDRLFDYATNTLTQSGTLSREWAEAQEAVESACETTSSDGLRVLKTLALLGLLKDERLAASEALLQMTYPDIAVGSVLAELSRSQRIVYRRRANVYRVFEGGDIDIEGVMQEARVRLSPELAVSHAAKALCHADVQIARRHSYRTGTVRPVNFVACSGDDLEKVVAEMSRSLHVIYCLCDTPEDLLDATAAFQMVRSPHLLGVIAAQSDSLKDAALDVLAAESVLADVPEIETDRAARRELSARQEAAKVAFRAEWLRLFAPHGEGGDGSAMFWYQGEPRTVTALLPFLSDMADATYPDAPILRNELINRRNLSSQAAAARRNLSEALLDESRVIQAHLGIKGFPPERSIYECILAATGLHRKSEETEIYFLAAPESGHDPMHLLPVWLKLEAMLLDAPPDPLPVHKLFEKLSEPPFGLTSGVLPLLLCVFLRVNELQTTMYRENTFVPEPGIADWELLLRRPEQFAVAGCRVTGEREAIVRRLADGLKTPISVVAVVRSLLRQTKSLPEYAHKTTRLSPEARKVRTAFASAKSPEQLLFTLLPDALGLTGLFEGEFFTALNAVLREWGSVYPALLAESRDIMLHSCGLDSGDAGFAELREHARRLEEFVGFAPAPLVPFLRRAALPGDSATVLDGVLALVGDRPPRTWDDAAVSRFATQARVRGELFREMVARSGDFTEPPLVADEAAQRDALAEMIRARFAPDLPPRLVRATLLQLLRDFPAP